MTSLIWNLIEINVLVAVLFLAYLGIRKQLTFVQQRLVLMSLPFMSIGAVLVKSLFDFSDYSYSLAIVQLEKIVVQGNTEQSIAGRFEWMHLDLIYWIGAIGFGLFFIYKFVQVFSFFRFNTSEQLETYRIYKVRGKSSFSFFNQIQISPELNSRDQEIVLEHEKMHADKWHSLDNIILEVCHVFCWFNPTFLFIKREMVNLHEFEVDALMYRKHKVNYMKFLVSYVLGMETSHYLLTSRFYNQLTLKKRIKTMKNKNKKNRWLLVFIPVLAIFATFVQCQKTDNPSTPPPPEVVEPVQPEQALDVAEVMPEYKGGNAEMNNFIIDNITYPQEAKDQELEGTVYVNFVVTKTGEITQVKVLKGVADILDREAKRVISAMPNWIPGEDKGNPVAVKFTIPISFRLS